VVKRPSKNDLWGLCSLDGKWSRLSGDGGLAMGMGDLFSLRQLDLPVKIIVFKNDSLAFVELEMKASGFIDFGTDLHNPASRKWLRQPDSWD
jgi:thiamine pyrophosphate-dependent acetolactate synthase large subunit-like protein